MLLKEIEIEADSRKLSPSLHVHRLLIHIIDLGPFQLKQNRAMGGPNELTPEKPH